MAERRQTGNKLQLLSQALSAAVSSLNLARQIVNEIDHVGSFETPGLVGKYDGMFMVTEAGKKYPVPDNYAAKTKLVYGDKLKMVEGPEGRRFKYIGRVPFTELEAKLTLKDGRFVAVAKEGSYKLLQSAVRHYNGEEGDKLVVLIPKDEKHAPFAALQKIAGKEPGTHPSHEGKKEVSEAPASAKAALGKKSAEAPSPSRGEGGEERGKKKPPAAKTEKKERPKAEAKETVAKPSKASPRLDSAKRVARGGKAAKTTKTTAKKTPSKKGERKIEPPGEEELR
jgi:hypothetical protein